MSSTFAYCRVTPALVPNAKPQLQAMVTAGFKLSPSYTVVEVVPASVAVSLRPAWRRLLDRFYAGDVLVVATLDSLGRNLQEACATIRHLTSMRLQVHCLPLGRMDLASIQGKGVMNAVEAAIDFEKSQQNECKRMEDQPDKPPSAVTAESAPTPARRGRPRNLTLAQMAEAKDLLAAGMGVVEIAERLQTSRQTIMRLHAQDQAGAATILSTPGSGAP